MFKLLRNVEGGGRGSEGGGGGRASMAAKAEGKEEITYKGW